MAIIKRAKREEKYCILPNAFLQDSTLSFECRGMIAYLLSHTEDWKCRPADLEREGKIGKDARRTMMVEAEKAGYITFHSERLANGRFNVWYDAHEEPVPETQRTQSWETGKAKSETSPGADWPEAVEPVGGRAGYGEAGAIRITDLRSTEDVIIVENPKANFPLDETVPVGATSTDDSGLGDGQPESDETVLVESSTTTPPEVAPAPPIRPQTDHQQMMNALQAITGQKILNGPAQGRAVKKILTAYTVTQAIEVLEWMADPNSRWNGKVDWLSVQNFISEYFRRRQQQQTKTNGGNYGKYNENRKPTDGTGQSALQRLCNRRALGDFG
jgi:hypothetical protein